jgi:hypothetical protein
MVTTRTRTYGAPPVDKAPPARKAPPPRQRRRPGLVYVWAPAHGKRGVRVALSPHPGYSVTARLRCAAGDVVRVLTVPLVRHKWFDRAPHHYYALELAARGAALPTADAVVRALPEGRWLCTTCGEPRVHAVTVEA